MTTGCTDQAADDEGCVGDIVVQALCDEVPLLALRGVAVGDLKGGEVGAEVSRQRVDEKTFAVRRLSCGERKHFLSATSVDESTASWVPPA